jgi:excisionase family DNA binding protein
MNAARSGGTGRLTLTVEEAARELGIGRTSAYTACRAGEIPSLRVGRRLLIPRTALDALLASAGHPLSNGTEPRRQPCSASDEPRTSVPTS